MGHASDVVAPLEMIIQLFGMVILRIIPSLYLSMTYRLLWIGITPRTMAIPFKILRTLESLHFYKIHFKAIQIWYNVTETLPSCINWDNSAPNLQNSHVKFPQNSLSRHSRSHKSSLSPSLNSNMTTSSAVTSENNICTLPSSEFDAATGWNTLVCNEGINLVNWWAQGMGDDLYWPPNQPQGTTMESMISTSLLYCKYYESIGLFGLPHKEDLYSKWLDTIYGGLRIQYASNIVFSNGNLDPWSPAGVTPSSQAKRLSNDGSVISLMIDMGGHHLDLFWSNENDPQSVR